METVYQEHSPDHHVIQDLKVTIHSSSLLFPSQDLSTERKSMFLSNIDQVLNFNVQTSISSRPTKSFLHNLWFRDVLMAYDFLARRLKVNRDVGRSEIDCNGAGVGFVVASSDCSLDEIGDLVYPNPAFRELILQSLDNWDPMMISLFAFFR